jgi:hypothetical protein
VTEQIELPCDVKASGVAFGVEPLGAEARLLFFAVGVAGSQRDMRRVAVFRAGKDGASRANAVIARRERVPLAAQVPKSVR